MKKIVLATSNPGKVRELANLLTAWDLNVVAQNELGVTSIEETGLTFVENAILKARHAAQMTGLPAIADDSGLVVDALCGATGLYSARYAGCNATDQQNLAKLLAEMAEVPDQRRGAAYHCVLVYFHCATDPTPLVFHGSWRGKITDKPIGQDGFGYDPIFYLPALKRTAAQLSAVEKQRISHRGQALKLLLDALKNA
ncbi:RdgB/HAM1 family non-canonical purine NTP pyrophosphatase [Candidatus Regiella insecticola]|nr:RdgB/HAM1 family non-canonical purine NTP pyrophosphatase [Candidatus Regiella insecticola]